MRNRNSIIALGLLINIIVSACTSTLESDIESTPTAINTDLPAPTYTSSQPANTTEAQVSIEAATLFKADFENGYPIGLYGGAREWYLYEESDGGSIFCNQISDRWSNFQFGSDDWTNYAVSLRVKFLSANRDQSAETYIRINQSAEGYRASIWQNEWAGIGFYPPYVDLGGSPVNISQGVWYQVELRFVEDNLEYYLNDEILVEIDDSSRRSGRAGFGAAPNTEACVDDILVWGLDENGYPIVSPTSLPEDPRSKYENNCVFCFLDDIRDPLIPIWDTESHGYTHQQIDLREQIIIDENFSVGANEEVLFENLIVWVRPNRRGDIDVSGKLVIRDSLLLWDQTEHQQTRLRIQNGGELIIKDSFAFWNNQYWVNWDFEDGSTIYLDHFVGDPWTSISGSVNYTAINYSTVKLTLGDDIHDTVVEVSDAHHVYLELFPSAGEHEITLPEKRQWADWELSDLWPETVVSVRDSYLFGRDVSISNDTHITVLDTPSGFNLGWAIYKNDPGFVDCELSDLGDPDNDDGVFYENKIWDLPCNNSSLTVLNSLLHRAWPVTYGYIHLTINRSNLVDPRNYGGPATMEIYDSTIDHIAAYRGGRVYIENSEIRYDIEVKDLNSAIFGYGVSSRDENVNIEIIEIDGGAYFELESPGPPW